MHCEITQQKYIERAYRVLIKEVCYLQSNDIACAMYIFDTIILYGDCISFIVPIHFGENVARYKLAVYLQEHN